MRPCSAGDRTAYRVVLARASQAEAALLFAVMADMLDGVSLGVLSNVPGPQRLALEVALRRAEPDHGAPEPFAIAAAFLHVLRVLAEQQPLLVAVDDVQWLDDASAQVLLFAARRLAHDDDSQVRFLLSRRPGRQGSLELGLAAAGCHLSLDSAREDQAKRHLASQGNPLFALELGRSDGSTWLTYDSLL